MLQAGEFIEAARALGFSRYAGVPCSLLTPFINHVINDADLAYVSAANEGDAVALAAGAVIGGERAVAMMQNSGLGNAVNPLTSLAWAFGIPLLLICTHRGAPGIQDEPQHALMGRITTDLLEAMEISWEPFPATAAEVATALARADDRLRRQHGCHALVMGRDTLAPQALRAETVPRRGQPCAVQRSGPADATPTLRRRDALAHLLQRVPPQGSALIATTGYTGRELYALEDRANHLYMVGSMGCAAALGLGLALARPRLRVIVIDGDGAALMRMGNLATVGSYGGDNLLHLILDNGMHESTGGQATVSANVDFAALAGACGYARAGSGADTQTIDTALQAGPGPVLAHLRIAPGTTRPLPRPAAPPRQLLQRFMQHLAQP